MAASPQWVIATLGGGVISWSAKKQKVVVTSSTEAEYIAASKSCKEGLWLRTLLSLLPLSPETSGPTALLCADKDDNGIPLYCNNNGEREPYSERARRGDYVTGNRC